jgi:transposase
MPALVKKPATTPIPVQLSDPEFQQFILPHLSMPKRGPRCKLGYHRVFNLILWVLYTGMQWKCLPVPQDSHGKPAIHYTTVYKVFARWSDDGSLEHAFIASVQHLSDHHQLDLSILHGDGTNTVAKKGGDGISYSGHKHQKGEKVIAIIDNNGYVLAPLPVAPVNAADTVLFPKGLKALKREAKLTGLGLKDAYLNLDGGFDSAANRKAIFNAGMIPNIKENGVFCPTPQKGIFQNLARASLGHWSLHQGLNNCWQVNSFWPLGELIPPTQIDMLPGHGRDLRE